MFWNSKLWSLSGDALHWCAIFLNPELAEAQSSHFAQPSQLQAAFSSWTIVLENSTDSSLLSAMHELFKVTLSCIGHVAAWPFKKCVNRNNAKFCDKIVYVGGPSFHSWVALLPLCPNSCHPVLSCCCDLKRVQWRGTSENINNNKTFDLFWLAMSIRAPGGGNKKKNEAQGGTAVQSGEWEGGPSAFQPWNLN